MATVCAQQNNQNRNEANTNPTTPSAAEQYESAPAYDYSYLVQDNLTGDNKRQEESRRGGNVQGSYSLVEPDG